MTSLTKAHLTCHCGSIQLDGAALSTSSSDHFPIETTLCHCTDCRYTSGGFYLGVFELRNPPSAELLAKCTEYAASDRLKRYFCTTCGSFAFVVTLASNKWQVGSGLVEQNEASKGAGEEFADNVMKIKHHFWVDDTRDYKIAARLQVVAGREVPVYAKSAIGTSPVSKDEVERISANTEFSTSTSNEHLSARCHCGSVTFQISRPDWSGIPSSAQPPPQHANKLRAAFCACRDCRTTAGCASILPWAFVPPKHILSSDGKEVVFSLQGPNIPGLSNYQSTKDKTVRSFCGTCGARVCYWNVDRQQIISVPVGILRDPAGAAASNWLWWRPAVFGEGETIDRELFLVLKDEERLERTQ